MIDKFKKWLSRDNDKKKNISYKPKLVGTDIDEFERESKDILSYVLDKGDLFLSIDEYMYEYKVALRVSQEDFGDMQDYHEQINGWDTKNFHDIKDDFISYFTYMSRKYNIYPRIKIGDDNKYWNDKEYNLEELEEITNLKFNYIRFYIRK